MPSEVTIKEPILVKNPRTGKHVNVAPLFNLIADTEGDETTLALKRAITNAIRFINLTPHIDGKANPAERPSLNYDLYNLEDMFEEMAHF